MRLVWAMPSSCTRFHLPSKLFLFGRGDMFIYYLVLFLWGTWSFPNDLWSKHLHRNQSWHLDSWASIASKWQGCRFVRQCALYIIGSKAKGLDLQGQTSNPELVPHVCSWCRSIPDDGSTWACLWPWEVMKAVQGQLWKTHECCCW